MLTGSCKTLPNQLIIKVHHSYILSKHMVFTWNLKHPLKPPRCLEVNPSTSDPQASTAPGCAKPTLRVPTRWRATRWPRWRPRTTRSAPGVASPAVAARPCHSLQSPRRLQPQEVYEMQHPRRWGWDGWDFLNDGGGLGLGVLEVERGWKGCTCWECCRMVYKHVYSEWWMHVRFSPLFAGCYLFLQFCFETSSSLAATWNGSVIAILFSRASGTATSWAELHGICNLKTRVSQIW